MEENLPIFQNPEPSDVVMSVSQCIALVNQTLDYAYPTIAVEGEVAGFKVNHSNYVFFDLKDSDSTLNCFMTVYQLRMPLEDGMRVRVIASPRLTKWGRFSLTVREVVPVGAGSLKRAYDLLKEKLVQEGLFAPERKRSLPRYPERVGLISSKQAAGYADFVKIMAVRWPLSKLDVQHCRVQGAGAADDIIAALRTLNEQAMPPEVIAIVRGGGSADDLACFNDETLVRAIAASRVPVIAGIGHEVDETLCSLAADVNASTPSNAAELLAPDSVALRMQLHSRRKNLDERLKGVVREQVQFIVHGREQLHHNVLRVIETAKNHLQGSRQLLKQLNPQTVLKRGYSVVRFEQEIMRDGRKLKRGDTLQIETVHAIIESEVTNVKSKK